MYSKIFLSSLLASLAVAAPADLDKRQGITSNDVKNGNCQPVTLIMARGSTEQGNMGSIVGSGLCAAMKDANPQGVACQGVGGAYRATLTANTLPGGTNKASIDEAVTTIKQAMTACPDSVMTLAGYRSVIALIIPSLPGLAD